MKLNTTLRNQLLFSCFSPHTHTHIKSTSSLQHQNYNFNTPHLYSGILWPSLSKYFTSVLCFYSLHKVCERFWINTWLRPVHFPQRSPEDFNSWKKFRLEGTSGSHLAQTPAQRRSNKIRLLSVMPREVLYISSDGDSTASQGNRSYRQPVGPHWSIFLSLSKSSSLSFSSFIVFQAPVYPVGLLDSLQHVNSILLVQGKPKSDIGFHLKSHKHQIQGVDGFPGLG